MADVAILRAARARIADPLHWTSKHLARNEVGAVVSPTSKEAVCWCAIGALQASGNQRHSGNAEALGDAALALFGTAFVGLVNDTDGHAAVLAIYDAAIASAEGAVGKGPTPLAARIVASLDRQCEAFNLLHPVGTRVRVWPGVFREGRSVEGEIREPGAYVLSGHTAVVFVAGCRGCVAISHVEGVA